MRRALLGVLCVLVGACATARKPPVEGAPEEAAQVAPAAPALPPPPPAAEPQASPQRPFLTPPEIFDVLEKSPVQYALTGEDSPPGGWADVVWPTTVEPLLAPRVGVEEGKRVLRPSPPPPPEVQRLLSEAEPHFEARRYAEAARLYAQATQACPECFLAWAFRGDAALFSGDAKGALPHYERAIELQPDEHRLHLYRGNALAQLGRTEEAVESWAWALVLEPRSVALRRSLEANPSLGAAVASDVVVPRGYARREGDVVQVRFDPLHHPAWTVFAACKAMWLGEAGHREEMTGSAEHRFTTIEEMECLSAAALAYQVQKEQEGQQDESLERLMTVLEDRMGLPLILFEMAARVHPQVTLTLDEQVRKNLRVYVLRHVLVPTGEVRVEAPAHSLPRAAD